MRAATPTRPATDKLRWQQSANRFTAFFNRLTKARLAGTALSVAIADAVGAELSAINAATDLPQGVALLWTEFLEKHVGLPGTGAPPADPLAKLRTMPNAQAEEAMTLLGDMQGVLAEALKKAR